MMRSVNCKLQGLILLMAAVGSAHALGADPLLADEPIILREEVLPCKTPPAYEALRGREMQPGEFPTVQKPWPRKPQQARCDALVEECRRLLALPAEEVKAHPAAAVFPGLPEPGAVPVKRTLRFPLGVARAREKKVILSTGLYAPPGEIIEISGLPADVATNVSVRINLQHNNQNNWNEHPRDVLERMPIIAQHMALKGARSTIANPFGGLLYLEASASLRDLTVTIRGGIPAPRFVLGQTDVKAWRESLRKLNAPWAELRSRYLALTLSSKSIRDLEDPRPVLEKWDRILNCAAELVSRPEPQRWPPERIAFDALRLGAHSGYPVIVYQEREKNALDFEMEYMKGMLHELGHNHQSPRWTERATVEVTCNLIRFYADDRVLGHNLADPAHALEKQMPGVARYLAGSQPFDARTPALHMFLGVARGLGWESFVQAFGALAKLAPQEVPTNNDAERALLVRQLSLAAKRDLRPYFTTWRFLTTAAPDAQLDALPKWVPEPNWPQAFIARYATGASTAPK